MYHLQNIEKKKYDDFVSNHKESHYLQSLSWGEFISTQKEYTPHYIGLTNDNNELVASALLLEKETILNHSYYYCPKGFIIDYKKDNLVKEMTKRILEYVKKNKGIYLITTPNIISKTNNKEEAHLEKILNALKESKYKHIEQISKNKEPINALKIDLSKDIEEIENNYLVPTKDKIKKALELDEVVEIGREKDLDELYDLAVLNNNLEYEKDYYKNLFKIFNKNKNTSAILFLGKIYFDKTIKKLESKLKKVNNQISIIPIDHLSKTSKEKLEGLKKEKDYIKSEIKKYSENKEKYNKSLTLSAQLIITYKDKAWVLFEENEKVLNDINPNYLTYDTIIRYCKDNGIKTLYRTMETNNNMGEDYIEYIGEYVNITNYPISFIHKLYEKKLKKED